MVCCLDGGLCEQLSLIQSTPTGCVCVCVCVCVCRILWDLETLTIERPKHELGYVATGGGGINSTYVAHAETDPYSSGLKNTL